MDSIAEKLNISKVSVHKALHGYPGISEQLKACVISAAAELGYSLVDPLTKLCRNYFYLIPQRFYLSTEQYYAGIYSELSAILENIGSKLEHVTVRKNFSLSQFAATNSRLNKGAFGVFWAGIIPEGILAQFSSQYEIPFVCIDYRSDKYPANYVFIDNYHSGYILTNSLIQKGHTNICAIIDIQSASTNADKYFGFRKALLENGIDFTPDMHINLSLASPHEFLNLRLPEKLPSAFILGSDFAAFNFMTTMMNNGRRIPADISVASFDNTRLSLECTPKLTTIGPEFSDIAKACYTIMLQTLLNRKKKSTFILQSILHERASVKSV
jgi:LacI family transcriptional regulator